jgi:RHS repeat-associated protein
VTQQSQSGGSAVAEKRADFAYNAAGQFVEITRHADVAGQHLVASTEFTYDGLGRLLTLDHLDPDAVPLAGYEFAWDAASRIVSIDSLLDGLSEYTHDHTSQLTAADHATQTNEVYEYDENGNRVMSGHVIGDNNQLLSDGTYSYTYDDEGNRATRTVIATGYVMVYAWDHRNRLIGVTEFDDEENILSEVKHEYDLFNRWIHRSVDPDGPGGAPAVDTYFSWFEGQLTLQFEGTTASDLGQRYFWNPAAVDQILASEDVSSLASPGEVLYPLTDHLGTTRDLAEYDVVEEETTIASHRVFDSFGVLISETSSAITILIGFTGRPLDESTGLQNNWNRWYDAESGRWPSEDPIGFGGQDPNLARYVGNSPVRYVDPSGLERAPQRSPGVSPWQALLGIMGHQSEMVFHIHQSASEAREKAWAQYETSDNMITRSTALLFGVGLGYAGEGIAYYGWAEGTGSLIRATCGLRYPPAANVASKGTQAAFEAAQSAWKNLPPSVRSMMHGVLNGTRPLSDFTKLPTAQRKAILDYYRTTGANASRANAEAVRQLNQHRLDYLNRLRPDPPGGIGNFPKPGGGS